jgi:hypothetical protein
MEQLARQFSHVEFKVIYTKEPHAGEGEFQTISQPKTFDERESLAKKLKAEEDLSREILIDEMESPVQKAYGNLPNMLYLIDPYGKIASKWDWADAQSLEDKLAELNENQKKD